MVNLAHAATASAVPQLMMIKWPWPHSLDFTLCLQIKTPLYTDEVKTPPSPVQVLSRKKGKSIVYETHMKKTRLVRLHSRQMDRLSCRLLHTYQKEKEKSTLYWIIFRCLAKICAHLLGAIIIFAPLCTSPVTMIIASSPPDTRRLGGVIHSPQGRKLRLQSEGTCPGASSKSIAGEGFDPRPSDSQPSDVGLKQWKQLSSPSRVFSGIKNTDHLRGGANSSPSPTTETRVLLCCVHAGTLKALSLCPDGSPH